MRISEATVAVAGIVRNYYLENAPDDDAVRYRDRIMEIVKYLDLGRLDAWEARVLEQFTDSEWEVFEKRPDFQLLDSVWEIGRFNLYGAIDSEGQETITAQPVN